MIKKEILKKCAFVLVVAMLIMAVFTIMLKYEVEGEKTLPYEISKILMISTVDGEKRDDPENIWNIGVTEVNDVYIYIDGNSKETIKEISIENFNIVKEPTIGNVKILRPTSDLPKLYTHSEQNYLDDKIVYTGAKLDDLKSLEVSNNGGVIGFRLSLNDLGDFISNEAQEIIYDGRLLSNLGISLEEIKLTLTFDLKITTSENVTYKCSLGLDMPTEEIIEKGTSNIEITDFSDIIFKRI